MKVKIGDTVYDGQDQMVMVILSDQDKFNIAHMARGAHAYCAAPPGTHWKVLSDWMGDSAEDYTHGQVDVEDKQCPACGHWESMHNQDPHNDRLDDGVTICHDCEAPCAMEGP